MKELQRDIRGVVRLINATAPIHRLPDETLAEIFLFFLAREWNSEPPEDIQECFLVLPAVCACHCVRPLALDHVQYRAILANHQRAQGK